MLYNLASNDVFCFGECDLLQHSDQFYGQMNQRFQNIQKLAWSILGFIENKEILLTGHWRENSSAETNPAELIQICIDYFNEVTEWKVTDDELDRFYSADIDEIIENPTFELSDKYQFQMELLVLDSYGNQGNHAIIACRPKTDYIPDDIEDC